MASDPLHEVIYDYLRESGEFEVGGGQNNWVSLTKRYSQKKWNRTDKRVCFVLYGPGMNFTRESGEVHIRLDFWKDFGLGEEVSKKFHKDNYALLHLVHHLLKYVASKRKFYGKINTADWVCFDVSDWGQFDVLIRQFNGLI